MPDLQRIDDRLARLRRIENPISTVIGVAAAALYVLWQLSHHYIATYSWLIPFFIGCAVPKFAFAFLEQRLENARAVLRDPASAPPPKERRRPIPRARARDRARAAARASARTGRSDLAPTAGTPACSGRRAALPGMISAAR